MGVPKGLRRAAGNMGGAHRVGREHGRHGLSLVESYQMGFGHAPLSNLYESLIFFAWTIIAIYLYIERRYGNRVIGAFSAPLAFLAMAYASLSPTSATASSP